jgi:putative NADPH-quinone reductase
MKKILIIDAHPDSESLGAFLCKIYEASARQNHEVEKIIIRDLKFDPILHYGYRKAQDLEADLLLAQKKITACQHLVLFTPNWWGSLPALAKGFFERIFIRGFSHRFNPKKKMAEKLLNGRSASVIYTQSSPKFYTKFITGDAFWKCIKKSILGYVGFSNLKRYYVSRAKSIDSKRLQKILHDLEEMGNEGF